MATKAKKKYTYLTKAIQLPDGTRKYIRGKDQKELEEKVLKAQIMVNAGVDICSEETFGHFAQMWYDIYKKPYLRENSQNAIKYVMNQHKLPYMEQSRTQQEFVAYMNAYGYDVKWEPHQKYITYTTPENIRCRDSKLFDQTLKRENMELYFRLGGANYLQACRKIAYDHREPTPTLEDAVCGMAGTVAAICALCEDEDSELSDLARELYYSSLLLQELVEWYQSRRQEQENYEEEYGQYHGFNITMM